MESRFRLNSDGVYDVLIIGAGQAAMPLIFALAKAGKRAALVERKNLGGSCVNFGCTPTKAVIASAQVAHRARRAAEFGLKIPTVEVDFPAVIASAQAIVRESRDGLADEFKNIDNPTLLRGQARIAGRDGEGFRVHIDGGASGEDQTVVARQIVLDTGTRAQVPPIDGLDAIPILTAGNWIDNTQLPEHLIFLGGGIIGLEMGQFYRRMGSRVTIVDSGEHILPHEEPEVAQTLQPLLEAEGIVFRQNVKATRAAKGAVGSASSVTVTLQSKDGKNDEIVGSHLFMAVGRKPNTDDLGLETVGVVVTPEGIVQTDDRLATNVEGIWVAGDIRGGPMFTHTSWDDYHILESQIVGDGSRRNHRLVPYALFTDPQMGRVGLTEAEARKTGKPFKIGHFDVVHNGRARETREKSGFVKILIDAETDRMIGATVVSDEAAELVQIYLTLMNADAPCTVIRDGIYIHPTFAEGIQVATETVK